jgi:hypothetical protein
MTALAAELMATQERVTRMEFNLAPGKKAYKGATAMGRPSTSFVYPAVTSAGAAGANDLFVGMFAETIDNSANTATTLPVTVDFLTEKNLFYRTNDGSLTATSVFNPCYAADDQTASATSTNAPKLGTVVKVDAVLGVAFLTGGF